MPRLPQKLGQRAVSGCGLHRALARRSLGAAAARLRLRCSCAAVGAPPVPPASILVTFILLLELKPRVGTQRTFPDCSRERTTPGCRSRPHIGLWRTVSSCVRASAADAAPPRVRAVAVADATLPPGHHFGAPHQLHAHPAGRALVAWARICRSAGLPPPPRSRSPRSAPSSVLLRLLQVGAAGVCAPGGRHGPRE